MAPKHWNGQKLSSNHHPSVLIPHYSGQQTHARTSKPSACLLGPAHTTHRHSAIPGGHHHYVITKLLWAQYYGSVK